MDLQIALVSAGVCVLSAVVVYLISIFGMREKTYEEAIEEQRKRNQEAAQHNKIEKPKKEKKFKKQGKRAKESRNSEEETEQQQQQQGSNHTNDHVEFKSEAEIIPAEAELEPNLPKPKNLHPVKKKSKTPKSILMNKQDVGPINVDSPLLSADDELDGSDSPPLFIPKDELERRHSLDIGQKKLNALLQNVQSFQEPIPETKAVVTEVKSQPAEMKPPVEMKMEKKSEESAKKNKKIRSDSFENEGELSYKKLLSTMKKVTLLDDEIQNLIDILLNKQQGGTEWTKKNDPVAVLKKQLADKEAALEGEQRSVQAATSKLREVRQELSQEKSRATNSERALRQELQTLHQRLQATVDQQTKAQQNQSKVSEEHSLNIQRLNEEKVNLQNQLALLEVERQKWVAHEREMQREIEDRYQASLVQEQERMSLQLQSKEKQLQQLLAGQQEGDIRFSQAMSEMKQELQESQSLNQDLDAELSTMRKRLDEKEMLKHKQDEEIQRLKRMAEEERVKLQGHSDHLQGQVKNATNQLQDFDRQLGQLRDEADTLRQQLAVAEQHKQSVEAAGDSQAAQLLQEKALFNTRLSAMQEALDAGRRELSNVQNDLESQKSRNNELHEKNWKVMDGLNTLEKASKEKEEGLNKKLTQVTQAHEQACMQIKQQQQQLTQLQEQQHNASDSNSGQQIQRIQEEDRSCLQRLLPDVQIDTSLEHPDWMVQFTEKVRERFASLSVLKADNSTLALQVSHYQTVLSETEDMLKKLQSSVEDQERIWADRLAAEKEETQKVVKEKQVLEDQLQQLQGIEEATAEMQGRLKELQAKLQGEETDKKILENKVEESVQRCATLTSELESKGQEVSRLRKEAEAVDRLTSQVDLLVKDLDKERKITKELGSQAVKLNSLVKIGQDSLKAEQDLVKKLQDELASVSSNSNNNNNNHNINNNKIPAANGTAVENESASVPVRTDKPNKGKKRGASAKK